jgi:hypothetical protein
MKFLIVAASLLFSVAWAAHLRQASTEDQHQQIAKHHVAVQLQLSNGRLKTWGSDLEHEARMSEQSNPSQELARLAHVDLGLQMRESVCGVLLLLGILLPLWKYSGSESDDQQSMQAEKNCDSIRALAESGDGSWAQAYRTSSEERQRAFELLICCKIISASEFLHSQISREHIDQCVWIASDMLAQKSLQDWVSMRNQALEAFQERVTAIFASRRMTNLKDEDSSAAFQGGMQQPAPLQAALNDLLTLKDGFPSPLLKTRSACSTAQASPVAPHLLPAALAEAQSGMMSIDKTVQCGLLDVTFDGRLPEGPIVKPVVPAEDSRSATTTEPANPSEINSHTIYGAKQQRVLESSVDGSEVRRGSPRPQPRAQSRYAAQTIV